MAKSVGLGKKANKEVPVKPKVEITTKPVEPPEERKATAKLPKANKPVEKSASANLTKLKAIVKKIEHEVEKEPVTADVQAKALEITSKPVVNEIETQLDPVVARKTPPAPKKFTAAPGKITMDDVAQMNQVSNPPNPLVSELEKYLKR